MGLALLVATLGVITIALGVIIFIKFGDVKPAAERAISYFSEGEASLESLHIDGSGRIEASSFHLEMPDGAIYDIKNISVIADFLSALSGRLEIESVIIDGPRLKIVSKKTKGRTTKRKAPAAKAKEEIAGESGPIPLFPIPVTIKSLVVKNISITSVDPRQLLSLGGFQILSKIDAGRGGIYSEIFIGTDSASTISIIQPGFTAQIEPTIGLKAVIEKDGKWSLDGDLILNLKNVEGPYAIKPGKVVAYVEMEGSYLKRLAGRGRVNVSFFDDFKTRIDARWEEKEAGMSYAVTSDLAKIDLTQVMAILGEKNLRLAGSANIHTFAAEGFLPDKAQNEARHKLSLKGELALTHFAAGDIEAPGGLSAKFNLKNLEILGEKINGSVAVNLDYPEMLIGKAAIKKGALKLSADFTETMDNKGFRKVDRAPGEGVVDLFFKAGDIRQGSLTLENIMIGAKAVGDFAAGEIRRIEGKASVSRRVAADFLGSMKNFGKDSFNLKTDITVTDLAWLSSLANTDSLISPTSGDFAGSIELTGAMGDKWGAPSIDVNINSRLTDFSAGIEKEQITIEKTDLKLDAKGKVGQAEIVTEIEASIEVKSGGISVADNLSLGAFSAAATVTSPGFTNNKTGFTARLDTDKVTVGKRGDDSLSTPASLEIEGVIDPGSGRRILKSAYLKLGQTGALSAKGWIDDAGRRFKLYLNAAKLDLSLLESFATQNDRSTLPVTGWGGTITASIDGEGTLPDSVDALKKSIPFTLISNIHLQNGRFNVEKEELDVEGLDLDLKVGISKSMITAAGGLWISDLESKKLFGAVTLDPTFEFDLSIVEMNRLIVERFVLDTPRLGFIQTLDGSVTGLKLASIFNNKNNYKKIVPELTGAMNAYFSFVLDERQKLFIDMDIAGDVTVDASLTIDPQKGLRLQGESEFKNFSIRKGDVQYIKNLNGSAPFVKTLAHAKNSETQNDDVDGADQKSKSVRETTFFDDLRDTGSSRESFVVELMEIGPVDIQNTMFDLNLDEARLGIDYLRTSLLGGGLTGSFHIKSEEGVYVLRTTAGFAGLDLQRMIKNDLGLTRSEAKVDGSVTVELKFRSDDEIKELDINSVNFSAYMTSIGSKALDRLLKFFDPLESSPSVMNARTLLKYATPKRVELIAHNGNLSLTIDQKYSPLLGGLEVTMPVIKRAPIHGLVNFEVIKSRLKKLSALKSVMRIVGATRLEVTESGEILLR